MIIHREPHCSSCKAILLEASRTSDWVFYQCPTCSNGNADLIGTWLPTDDDTNYLFYRVALKLNRECRIPIKRSIALAQEYYQKFTNEAYCTSLGIPVQDDDFFHQEYVQGICQRIQYYLIQNQRGDNSIFLLWRKENF